MVAAVELAMGVVQLTAVLIPLLLGLTRYYVNNEREIELSDSTLRRYMALLFLPLFLAYLHSFTMINAFGNRHLTTAVAAYGAFLLSLFAAIPYMLDQEQWAYLFVTGGMGFAILTLFLTGIVFFGAVGIIYVIVVLLLSAIIFYLTQEEKEEKEKEDEETEKEEKEKAE